jgi:uncharacterized membrane protein
MTIRGAASILRGAAVVLAVVAWALLAHFAASGLTPPDVSVAVAVTPLMSLFVILLWRTRRPSLAVALALVAFAVLAWTWPDLRSNVSLIYFLQHVGINLALAALFGHSLGSGREAVVVHLARLARGGELSPVAYRYCRRVTVAWTVFFVLMAAVSAGLFLFGRAEAWSFFANLLTMPLVLAMFVAEQFTRNRLPPEDRTGFADTIRAYRAARQERVSRLADQP